MPKGVIVITISESLILLCSCEIISKSTRLMVSGNANVTLAVFRQTCVKKLDIGNWPSIYADKYYFSANFRNAQSRESRVTVRNAAMSVIFLQIYITAKCFSL